MPPLSLRDKTRAVRREHVLRAALDVFAQKGFRGATIRDVARAAGVSDGTIYNTFENKAALLLALLDPLEAAPPGAGEAREGEPVARVSALIKDRWGAYTPEMLASLRVVLSEVLIDADLRTQFFTRVIKPALDGVEALFRSGLGGGEAAILTSRIVTGQLLGLILLRLLGDEALEIRQDLVPDRIAELFDGGLGRLESEHAA